MPMDEFDESDFKDRLIAGGVDPSSAGIVAARTAEARRVYCQSPKSAERRMTAASALVRSPVDAAAAAVALAPNAVPPPDPATGPRGTVYGLHKEDQAADASAPPSPKSPSKARMASTSKKKTAVAQLVDQAAQLEQMQILKSAKAAIKDQQQSLFDVAPWGDDMRAMPNDLLRTAVFTTRNKRVPRDVRQNYPVFVLHKGVEVTYTGIELRADDDELVWQQVLEYAKHEVVGAPVSFTFYELCKDLGWSINGRYYDRAEACLTRLQATALQFVSNRIGRLDSISLISRFRVLDRGKKSSRCQVEIDEEMVVLFAGQYYSKFQWEKYRSLSPTARRMFDYFVSHSEPFPMKLESFRQLCGSDSERLKKWTEQSNKACDELTESGLVKKTWVESGLIWCDR